MQATGASEAAPSNVLTATFAAATVKGDLLVLSASVYSDATDRIITVSDSSNNTWKKIGAFNSAGHDSDGEMWYAVNTSPVTAVAVTVASPTSIAMTIQEFSGVTSPDPVDVSAGTSTKSVSASSGAVSPTAANYLAVGFVAGHSVDQTITVTASYITNPQQTSNGGAKRTATLISGYKYLSSMSAESFTAKFHRSMYWASGLAIFATSSPAPAPAPSPSPSPAPSPSPSASPSPSPTTSSCNLTPPIRAAFYYPWYPENWTQGGVYPATQYHPAAGFYSLSDSAGAQLERDHIASMQYGNIQAGIASWWGQGTLTDGRIAQLLSVAHGTGFCWTLYYEPSLNATQVASDLAYIANHYASDSSFLHVNGKPVLFVYSRSVASCTDTATWTAANAGRFYLNLQVFGGYTACPSQPDSWHQYGPAVAEDHQPGYSFSISPGFNKYNESSPRLTRDPVRWATDVAYMVASNEPWQLITTFNEWMEGTSVEDATEWASASGQGVYLDTLHSS